MRPSASSSASPRSSRAPSRATRSSRSRALITRLIDDYGFIETVDGREIYFHRNSLVGDTPFEALEPGAGVAFSEEAGEEGPQASSVRVVDRRGRSPGGSDGETTGLPSGIGR